MAPLIPIQWGFSFLRFPFDSPKLFNLSLLSLHAN